MVDRCRSPLPPLLKEKNLIERGLDEPRLRHRGPVAGCREGGHRLVSLTGSFKLGKGQP